MVSERYSSESESSDDDNLANLRAAADPDLINDGMFQLTGEKSQKKTSDSKAVATQKSQRHIADDNEHIDDLLIPEEIQKFVSKKLTKIIENRVEFVDVHSNVQGTSVSNAQEEEIKLLDDVVLKIDWTGNNTTQQGKRQKPEIKKRKLPDDDSSQSEFVRIREAAIELEDVRKEVSNWKGRAKGAVFEYREKNGRMFEVEQKNEFSEKRWKNKWDESKISRNKSCWSK